MPRTTTHLQADLVKVRLQAATGEAYSSTWAAFKQIYTEEGGVRALYRGTLPTVQRAAILTATQLGYVAHACPPPLPFPRAHTLSFSHSHAL